MFFRFLSCFKVAPTFLAVHKRVIDLILAWTCRLVGRLFKIIAIFVFETDRLCVVCSG